MAESKDNSSTSTSLFDPSLVSNYDTFIFDCDGVVWRGSDPIPGAKESLQQLQTLGKKLIFLSNNSTKTIETYQSKFSKLFDLEIPKNNIFTSAVATASYLNSMSLDQSSSDHNNNNTDNESKQDINNVDKFDKEINKIVLIGSIGLYTIISNQGFKILWTSNENDFPGLRNMKSTEIADIELDNNVRYVVCGMDQSYTYQDTCIGCRYLNEINTVQLIGSNDDTTFPVKSGIVLSGTGSLLAAVKATLPNGKEMVTCGKPHKLLFDLIKREHNTIDPNKTIMVGDRLNTDIVFGNKCGLDTLLVLSGITTKEAMGSDDIKSTYYLDSIKDLFDNSS